MKPKKTFFFAAIVAIAVSQVSGQTYTEILEGGWGQGRRFIRPCITDLDGNGLLDLLLGENEGGIRHLEQESPGSISFVQRSINFNGIDAGRRASPTFTDLDNDALLDLIIGKHDGTIMHFEQDSAGSISFSLLSESFNEIDIGRYATPRFVDLDNDELLDLIIGAEEGNIIHYEQDTEGSMDFSTVTDNFNGIDVGAISTPCFTDLDDDGLLDMIIGVNVGHLQHYEQNSSGSDQFSLVSENFNEIDVGAQACPVFTDLDDDGLMDLMIGDMSGFLPCYEQDTGGSENVVLISAHTLPGIDIGGHAFPSIIDLKGDGLWDLIIGNNDGTLDHFKQESIGSPSFSFFADTLFGIEVSSFSSPVFIDLDHNGLMDMIVGEFNGNLNHYEQTVAGSFDFTLITDSFNNIELGDETAPAITDLNADGLFDLIVGRGNGTLCHYVQDGIGSTGFSLVSDHFNDIDVGWVAKPSFTSLFDDGLLDMIIGEQGGALFHYKQDSLGSSNFTLISENFNGFVAGGNSSPAFADINRDGIMDLLVGNENGGIRYFRRNEETGVGQESMGRNPLGLISNYPNPFFSYTHIRYTLHEPARVKITICNMLGQQVRLLENSYKSQGDNVIRWDGTDEHGRALAGGFYICRMQTDSFQKSIKILLLK